MRFYFFILLFFSAATAFSSVPKEENTPTTHFGVKEFNKVLTYTSEAPNQPLVSEQLNFHFQVLAKRKGKYKKESKFVEYAFYYIHKKLLKRYEQYASISQTVSTGAYDCVTATAMYSLFLTGLNIPCSVVETNYHIYILVYPGTSKEVLLETTDPMAGFITDKQQIAERKLQYKQRNKEEFANQAIFNWDIETILKGQELTGVLLYNQSVKHFNLGNNTKAKTLAKKALQHYNSNRIKSYLDFLEGNQIASN